MIFFRRTPEYDQWDDMTLLFRLRLWTSGWRGALVLSVLIVPSLVIWKGEDAYNSMKMWRAQSLINQAEAALVRGDNKESESLLNQATVLIHRQPIMLRAVARFQVATYNLEALNTYRALLETSEATAMDKVAMCRQAFRAGQPELASAVIDELGNLPGPEDMAVLLALKAEKLAADGHWPEAVQLARQAGNSAGNEEEKAYSRKVLARLLLLPPPQWATEAQPTEGLDLMSSLALRQDALGLEALEILVNLSRNPQMAPLLAGRDFDAIVATAEKHPGGGAALKVNAWNLRVAARLSEREAVIREFFDHFKVDPSSLNRLEAARWLNQQGIHKMVIELAEPSKLESKDWFALYLDATAAQGHWEDIHRVLSSEDHQIPLAPVLRKLFDFRAQMETGHHPDADSSWQDILLASRTANTSDQLYVAGYAERIGFPMHAAKIYEQLLNRVEALLSEADRLGRSRRLACYIGLLRNSAGNRPLEDLCKLVRKFADEFPEIDEVQNDSAYLALLAEGDLDGAEKTARRLLLQKPELLSYRTTLALTELKRKRITEAADVYRGYSIDWETAPDRYKAVYAAVMRASGRTSEADQVASRISVANLRPEELRLAGLP